MKTPLQVTLIGEDVGWLRWHSHGVVAVFLHFVQLAPTVAVWNVVHAGKALIVGDLVWGVLGDWVTLGESDAAQTSTLKRQVVPAQFGISKQLAVVNRPGLLRISICTKASNPPMRVLIASVGYSGPTSLLLRRRTLEIKFSPFTATQATWASTVPVHVQGLSRLPLHRSQLRPPVVSKIVCHAVNCSALTGSEARVAWETHAKTAAIKMAICISVVVCRKRR
jgi:hypothetical protein